MADAPKRIAVSAKYEKWPARSGHWMLPGEIHPKRKPVEFVRADLYGRAVAALKEATLWLPPEPLQTVRAAIEEADDED